MVNDIKYTFKLIKNLSLALLMSIIIQTPCYSEENKKEDNSNLSFLNSKLNIYGWFSQNIFYDSSNKEAPLSFAQRNFNLITNFNVDDHLHFFSNIFWSSAERGSFTEDLLGTLEMEQAWAEYSFSDYANIRVGQFLSPFGIWNQNHPASNSYLSVYLPKSFYGEGPFGLLFSENNRGVLFHGSKELFNESRLKYDLYISQSSFDNTKEKQETETTNSENSDSEKNEFQNNIFNDKSIGGRLRYKLIENLTLGSSFFIEKNGIRKNAFSSAYAGEISYNIGNFEAWAELIFARNQKLQNNKLVESYQNSLGYYIWLSYNLFDNFIPYLTYSSFISDVETNKNIENYISGGLSYTFSANLMLKSQATFFMYPNDYQKNHNMYAMQFAISF